MCYYLHQWSLGSSGPYGAFQMAGSSRGFCQGLGPVRVVREYFLRQGVQLDREKPIAQPRCCTPPFCVGFANTLPRLLVKHSQNIQMKAFNPFPASK